MPKLVTSISSGIIDQDSSTIFAINAVISNIGEGDYIETSNKYWFIQNMINSTMEYIASPIAFGLMNNNGFSFIEIELSY